MHYIQNLFKVYKKTCFTLLHPIRIGTSSFYSPNFGERSPKSRIVTQVTLRMKSLLPFIVSAIVIAKSNIASSDTFYLIFHNTGSEDVYYSTAIRRARLFGWGDWRASGWYALPAGSTKQVYAGANEQVAFAFKKRGGYIIFKQGSSTPKNKWLKGWHVATADPFDYRFKNNSQSSRKLDGFVEMSFGYHYEQWSMGTSHTLTQEVNINTSKSHHPIPFKKNQNSSPKTMSPDDFLNHLDSAIKNNRTTKNPHKPETQAFGLERIEELAKQKSRQVEDKPTPIRKKNHTNTQEHSLGLERIETLSNSTEP